MAQFLLIAAIIFIIVNLIYFFRNKTYKKSYFSTALFMKLFFVLCGVTFGFALLYYALSFGETVIVHDLSTDTPVEHSFSNLLYFSGVTILAVGYGDMIPVNSARFFALIQAAIGVLLPTAYFIKALDQSRDE
ncbi:two pore domain potassium channel family protein [Gracilibacillus salitolerans]|uniref:Two pore domain potassium channel family protein n=1 Tax=Gracilibacillus salitolerans TaxID=2663022 RepID=A0A5Q2TFS8_9BACI|nr:potassium channel family protein [Gracilibacillus salitolerans]QGH33002.1 two pore domain potassium channel family protein [Gracilibacillus salitolerans]